MLAYVWRSQDNLQKSVLSLHYVCPRIDLRFLYLEPNTSTCWDLVDRYINVDFYQERIKEVLRKS